MRPISQTAAIAFLEDAAKFFERRPTDGEDMTHWANRYNAENCRRIALAIRDGFLNTAEVRK